MSTQHIEKFFKPTSIAVIGASDTPDSVGHIILNNILEGGYGGQVYAINPKDIQRSGTLLKRFRSVTALRDTPDLAVICSPPKTMPDIVARLSAQGTRAIILVAEHLDGIDMGTETRAQSRLKQALDAAQPYGTRILGPGALGVMATAHNVFPTFSHQRCRPGKMAYISDSGTLSSGFLDWANNTMMGFSHFVHVGESGDVDSADMLDYLAQETSVRAILVALQTIPDPDKFLSACRQAARAKPVIVHLSGAVPLRERTAFDPSTRHMISARANDVFAAAMHRVGVLATNSLMAMVAAAEVLARGALIRGDGIVLLANGQGILTIAQDQLHPYGASEAILSEATAHELLTRVPEARLWHGAVQLPFAARPDMYQTAVEILARDAHVDVIGVLHAPAPTVAPEEVATALVAADTSSASVLTSFLGDAWVKKARDILAAGHLPTFITPEAAMGAYIYQNHFRRAQSFMMEIPPHRANLDPPDPAQVRSLIQRAGRVEEVQLDATTRNHVLAGLGLPLPIPGPLGPDTVGTTTTATARTADLSVTIALTQDETFGPVVMITESGHPTWQPASSAVGLPPMNAQLALGLLRQARLTQRLHMLDDSADQGASLTDQLVTLLQRVSRIPVICPEIKTAQFGPVHLSAQGLSVHDVTLCLHPRGEARTTVIKPYPGNLTETIPDRQGKPLLLRPVRPEDEDAYRTFLHQITPEDMRRRFFYAVREVPTATLYHFTTIDYGREMAFCARDIDDDGKEGGVIGSSRVFLDSMGERAEFAILVRSDMKGRGLGVILMEKLFRYLKARNVKEIWGDVLEDNHTMLAFVQKLGFTVEAGREEDTVLIRRPI